MKLKTKFRLTSWQVLALGFLVIITIGSLLLSLPFATKSGQNPNYLDALFTATSATCVTGLVTVDTNTYWSIFGQVVILCLIQIGGLGFMTFVSILFGIFGKNMGLYTRKTLMLSTGESGHINTKQIVKRIVIGTIIFEVFGAIMLAIRFIPQFGVGKGLYYSVWHSISAFCNAGFDLMGGTFGQGTFVSFTAYKTDPLVSLTICFLIIMGGLGFIVWGDIIDKKFRFKKFALNTKVILVGTISLLVLSAALFMVFEYNTPNLDGLNFFEKLLVSFFNAVTPRTAGFNTVDLSTLSDSGYFLTVILMFIGGNSASTAGGIKVGTFMVVLTCILSSFRKSKDISLFKKRLKGEVVSQALSVFSACMFIVITATLVICAIEPIGFRAILFECFSALGTVGLSLSVTPTLSVASKIIIMLLMYIGRVGILTLGLAFAEKRFQPDVKYPEDQLLIG